MDVGLELKKVLEDAAARLGKALDLEKVGIYARARMVHLAGLIGKEGFAEAFLAERDNVALVAGIVGVEGADAADRELLGVVTGALAVGARMLVGRLG